MADDTKVPVAIRITRPYDDEEAFLAREIDTLTKTSIVLVGAQPRPQGVVLRFELALGNGTPLVRGEGRVVAYKERAFESFPGLTLRFTRLDSKSKQLIDRAAAIREARARGSAPPPSLPPPSVPIADSSPLPPAASSSPSALDLEATKAEAPRAKSQRPPPMPAPRAAATAPPPPTTNASRPPRAPISEPIDLEATKAEVPRAKSERPPVPRPSEADRDELLGRLRARVKTLDEDRVQSILERGKRR